jgi:V/A-type H+-transporting ATPase subunit I
MVQLETYSDVTRPETLEDVTAVLDEFNELGERYRPFWPRPRPPLEAKGVTDVRIATEMIETLRDWAREAEASIAEIQTLRREHDSLVIIDEWLRAVPEDGLPDLRRLGTSGPVMATRLYALPPETWPSTAGPSVLLHKTQTDARNFLLAVGRARQIDALDETMRGLKARCLTIPAWLPADRYGAVRAIEERWSAIAVRERELDANLQSLQQRYELPAVLAHMKFLQWMVAEVPQMATTEHFAWVTGWTSDVGGATLRAQLDASGLDHLIRFPPAPERAISPMILNNPRWARDFEVFGGLMGTPSAQDVDPTTILALVTPLMFGYMFGDIGHGAVMIVAGFVLRRYVPALSLLIPGGAMAMVFGVLFGSIFANESLLPALWLRPLEVPLPILIIALVFGVCIITLGIVLDGVQAYWSGQAAAWWQTRAGLLLAYLGLVGAVLEPNLLWLAVAGVAWFLAGEALRESRQRLQRLGAAAAEALETLFQLLVNTVSFIRVGAFALAHAGLSVAIMGIADAFASAPAQVAAYLFGNLFVLVLEGLVVGIQTTRLVLFEFFIRFLRVEGRAFRPLAAPRDNGE